MSSETLEATLRLFLLSDLVDNPLTILWHAGEPLTPGLEFYRKASTLIRKFNERRLRIVQSIQTNGTLLNREWGSFLREEAFEVGVSVDGPAHIHDVQRRTVRGSSSHARVMRGIEILREQRIPLHAIAVLSERSLDYPDEVFDFFAKAEFKTVGFNLEETEGSHVVSLTGANQSSRSAKYRRFMDRVFDRWIDAGGKPQIREFQVMSSAIGNFLRNQNFRRTPDDVVPFRNIVVSRQGNISTFSPELASGVPGEPTRFAIGNVHDLTSASLLLNSPKFVDLDAQVAKGLIRCEEECEYFPICGGGSCSNKFYEKGTFDCAETLTCSLHLKQLANIVATKLRHLSTAAIASSK